LQLGLDGGPPQRHSAIAEEPPLRAHAAASATFPRAPI